MRLEIIKNRIKCNHCGDIIESKNIHDYVTCSCGCCSVDGGHAYLRRSAKNTEKDYTEMSEIKRINESEGK